MKDWKYVLYLGILGSLLLLAILSSEKKYDWNVTLAHEDKNPYGTYALNSLLSSLKKVKHSYNTFYEINDSLSAATAVLILAERFQPSNEEVEKMLNYMQSGGTLFVSANSIRGKLSDTLQIETHDRLFQNTRYVQDLELTFLRLRNASMDTLSEFHFKQDNIFSYFTPTDTFKTGKFNATVIASNNNNQAVGVRIIVGKGSIIMCSTPLVFTNYCLLKENNSTLISSLLSYIPQSNIYWTEYYQLGRQEISSPLRFILRVEPLRWAYYLAIGSVIVFIFFEAKRRQRIIPVIKPLPNTTVDFVNTIGGLYYENADHKSIALMRIHSFQEMLRSKLYFHHSVFAPNFVQALSQKSGVAEETVQQLSDSIQSATTANTISDADLRTLHQRIQNFWAK